MLSRRGFLGTAALVSATAVSGRVQAANIPEAPIMEKATMQPLDQRQGFEIVRTDVVEASFAIDRLHRFGNGFQHDTFPVICRCYDGEALAPSLDVQPTSQGLRSL